MIYIACLQFVGKIKMKHHKLCPSYDVESKFKSVSYSLCSQTNLSILWSFMEIKVVKSPKSFTSDYNYRWNQGWKICYADTNQNYSDVTILTANKSY